MNTPVVSLGAGSYAIGRPIGCSSIIDARLLGAGWNCC